MTQLPTGTVTFLFTDIEGSTRLVQRLGDGFHAVVEQHGRILREAIASGGGTEVNTEGDSFFAAFPTPAGGLRAAVHAQRRLAAHPWADENAVRVRMGLHTGEGVLGGDDYVGLDVHRAARISAAGHGGQVLISEATRSLVERTLPNGVSLRDLGLHRLKDIEHPEHIYELVIDGLPAEFPAIRTLDPRPMNLPPQRTSFVGRDREVNEVASILAHTRLLTLSGPGGTGKTRLALKVAADQLDQFTDGVFFADLSPILDPALVPSVIAQVLMVRGEPGREVLDTLADHLRDRHLLLVLDNSEQVIEAGLAVARLLDAAPRLTVLATSRVPLHISGESEYQVPPLGLPEAAGVSNLDMITRSEAVALLTERAAAVRPGFRVTGENASAVAEITTRLDGLPLAIELAASRLKVLSPKALLARLENRLPLLSGGTRDLPERQRTLRGTIEWSYDLLEPEQQHLFARLAAFAGGWTLEAAEALSGDVVELEVLDRLSSLVDQSLVRHEETPNGEMRFRMLETIREYAAERLAQSSEEEEIRRLHAEHFRNLAEEAEPHLTREDRIFWLARLEGEYDNLRAALDWAERSDAETGLRTAAAIWRFWLQRGHLSEGRARLEVLLAVPVAGVRGPVRARALGALGGITYWQNDYPATRAAYEEAVDIAREIGDAKLLASTLLDLSYIPYLEQNPEGAEVILREGLTFAEEAGDRVLTADYWSSIAFLEVVRGNPAAAIEPRRTALEMLREEGAFWKLGDLLGGQAMISRMVGDLEAAKAYLHEALEMSGQAKDTLSISMWLTSFAILANDERHHERAARLVGAVARIRHDIGGGIPPELGSRWGDPNEDARRALGDEAYRQARADGYAMETEVAVAYALEDGE